MDEFSFPFQTAQYARIVPTTARENTCAYCGREVTQLAASRTDEKANTLDSKRRVGSSAREMAVVPAQKQEPNFIGL